VCEKSSVRLKEPKEELGVSDKAEWSLESLPEWAQDAIKVALKPEVSESASVHQNDASWPLLLEAAVVKSFLPSELAPNVVKGEERSSTEQVVLGFAETTREPNGIVKWSLKQEARVQVLQVAINTEDLKAAIQRTSVAFADKVSRALRDWLTEGSPATENLDLPSLEATRIAANSLAGVSAVDPLEVEDLDREIEFRRLLRVFERMVGRRKEEGGAEQVERFFGRDNEMENLRGYVGVIPSDSIAGTARRALNWLSRTITGRAPMAVWGVGGVGKTTLISKFMLEHAEAAVSRYPFAYLDFDRNTISARQRSGLLTEMCLQAGSQFKDLTKPMADLRGRVRELARKLETSHEFEYMSLLTPYTQEFRRLIDEFLTNQERTFEFARPFLLVFDTFEVVQYSEDDVVGLQEFVEAFSHPSEKRMWNRMRLIISGRKEVANFLGEVEKLPLGALDPAGSAAMLTALAADADKPISDEESEELVKAVAKATEEPEGGVQPLRLRLIGDVFTRMPDDGPTIVDSLVRELNEPLKSEGLAAQVLIDGILVRRVLGHVHDKRVRALADPGLVVRRITPDVIREVMTRATCSPAVEEAEDSDTEPLVPWVVDETEAKSIFDAFAKEITLVEFDDKGSDGPDGPALRHRSDVRQQMLPLIKARRPNRFSSIHRLAYKHFRDRAERDEKDLASAGEAIYHGLWLDEPLVSLNSLWRTSPGFDPRIDPDEFLKDSPAKIYIRAKTRAKLNPNDVSKLPPEVALEWVNDHIADLLEERRIEDAVGAFRSAAGENYEALGDNVGTAAALARLLYRSGSWNESIKLASRYFESASVDELRGPDEKEERRRKEKAGSRRAGVISFLRTSITIEAKSGEPGQAAWRALIYAPTIRDPFARIEVAAYTILASARAGKAQNLRCEELKEVIRESVKSVSPSRLKTEQKAIRLAILATNGTIPELLDLWVDLREKVSREIEVSTFTDAMSIIFRDHPAASEVAGLYKELRSSRKVEAWNKVDELWRLEKATVLQALRTNPDLKNAFWALLSYEHSDWIRPVGNALTRALKGEDGDALVAFLDKSNFWDRKARRDQGREHDGVGVVQSAADEGKLLKIADALANWKGSKQKPGATSGPYPQDVFDVSKALVKWHSTIVEDFRPLVLSL
jgi:hypothetical protein